MNAKPQSAEKLTNTTRPGSPVEKRTPTMAPTAMTGRHSGGDHGNVGHHQAEQQCGPPDWRHAQPVEVAALYIGHESGALDMPVTAKAMAMGRRNAL